MKERSLKATPRHILPELNMNIFQILKGQMKKAKLQIFQLHLQKPKTKYYQLSPQIANDLSR